MFSMLECCYSDFEVIAVRVRGAAVLVFAYWLTNAGLCEGGREGDGLDDGAGDWIVRRTSMLSLR